MAPGRWSVTAPTIVCRLTRMRASSTTSERASVPVSVRVPVATPWADSARLPVTVNVSSPALNSSVTSVPEATPDASNVTSPL